MRCRAQASVAQLAGRALRRTHQSLCRVQIGYCHALRMLTRFGHVSQSQLESKFGLPSASDFLRAYLMASRPQQVVREIVFDGCLLYVNYRTCMHAHRASG